MTFRFDYCTDLFFLLASLHGNLMENRLSYRLRRAMNEN